MNKKLTKSEKGKFAALNPVLHSATVFTTSSFVKALTHDEKFAVLQVNRAETL